MSKKDHEIIHVNKSFNKYLVTGRPKNHTKCENQVNIVSGLPSQNQNICETQFESVNQPRSETQTVNVNQLKNETHMDNVNHKIRETHTTNVNQYKLETQSINVKRMVGWSIPPTIKFTVTPIPKYRIG